jgi:two-component system nitrogen regulation response regulator GlnG
MRHFLTQAGQELGCEPKSIAPDALAHLERLDWPGNVRQLENTARWLTVMASTKEIRVNDLPPDLSDSEGQGADDEQWETALRAWTRRRLRQGDEAILDSALPAFERILIQVALEHTGGRRQEAAKLLGWGRNTLTRKIKDLNLDFGNAAGAEDDEDAA